MGERQIHPIDEYLSEEWIHAWAKAVVAEIEHYLAKHAAFNAFLTDANPPPPTAEA